MRRYHKFGLSQAHRIACIERARVTQLLTEGDDLPHEDAEAPDVRLGREHAEVERLRRHPADGQRPLQTQ